MKGKRFSIPVVIVIAVIAVLLAGTLALGAFLFQKSQSGSIEIIPNGDIVVTADLAFGGVHVGDVVTKSVSIQNNASTAVTISYGNLMSSDNTVALVSMSLSPNPIPAGQTATGEASFTVQTPEHWGVQDVTWAITGTTN